MTIVPQDELEKIIPIIDDLCAKGSGHSVNYYKDKYHLSNEEYSMIFDLTMPFIRLRNEALFWRNRYAMMRNHIYHIMPKPEEETDLTKKIRRILKEEYEITSEREMMEEDEKNEE